MTLTKRNRFKEELDRTSEKKGKVVKKMKKLAECIQELTSTAEEERMN